MEKVIAASFFFSLMLDLVMSDIVDCGSYICTGDGVYCCNYNQCCVSSSIWTLWWFWMVWVGLFCLLLSCGFWCRARMRARRGAPTYIAVQQPLVYGPPTYGTVCPGTTATPLAGSAPVMPPGYAAQPPPYQEPKLQNQV